MRPRAPTVQFLGFVCSHDFTLVGGIWSRFQIVFREPSRSGNHPPLEPHLNSSEDGADGPKAKAKQSRHSFLLGSRPQRLTEWSNEIMDMMSQAWPAADVFIPLENKRRTRLFVRTP